MEEDEYGDDFVMDDDVQPLSQQHQREVSEYDDSFLSESTPSQKTGVLSARGGAVGIEPPRASDDDEWGFDESPSPIESLPAGTTETPPASAPIDASLSGSGEPSPSRPGESSPSVDTQEQDEPHAGSYDWNRTDAFSSGVNSTPDHRGSYAHAASSLQVNSTPLAAAGSGSFFDRPAASDQYDDSLDSPAAHALPASSNMTPPVVPASRFFPSDAPASQELPATNFGVEIAAAAQLSREPTPDNMHLSDAHVSDTSQEFSFGFEAVATLAKESGLTLAKIGSGDHSERPKAGGRRAQTTPPEVEEEQTSSSIATPIYSGHTAVEEMVDEEFQEWDESPSPTTPATDAAVPPVHAATDNAGEEEEKYPSDSPPLPIDMSESVGSPVFITDGFDDTRDFADELDADAEPAAVSTPASARSREELKYEVEDVTAESDTDSARNGFSPLSLESAGGIEEAVNSDLPSAASAQHDAHSEGEARNDKGEPAATTAVKAASSESAPAPLSKPSSRPASPPRQRNAILPGHSAPPAPPSPLRELLANNDARAISHDRDLERVQQMDAKVERARQEHVAVELNKAHRRPIHAQLPDSHFAPAPVPTKEAGLPRVLQTARAAPVWLSSHVPPSVVAHHAQKILPSSARAVPSLEYAASTEKYERATAKFAAFLRKEVDITIKNTSRSNEPSRFSAMDAARRGEPQPAYGSELAHHALSDRARAHIRAVTPLTRADINTRLLPTRHRTGAYEQPSAPTRATIGRQSVPSHSIPLSSAARSHTLASLTTPSVGAGIARLQQRASNEQQRVYLLKLAFRERERAQEAVRATMSDAASQAQHAQEYEGDVRAIHAALLRREAAERRRAVRGEFGDSGGAAAPTHEEDAGFYDAFDRERNVRAALARAAERGVPITSEYESRVLARGADAESEVDDLESTHDLSFASSRSAIDSPGRYAFDSKVAFPPPPHADYSHHSAASSSYGRVTPDEMEQKYNGATFDSSDDIEEGAVPTNAAAWSPGRVHVV